LIVQDKYANLEAASNLEISKIRKRATFLTASMNGKGAEIVKRLEDSRRAYVERCGNAKKHSRMHFQKFVVSIGPIKNEFKASAGTQMSSLRNNIQTNFHKKTKSFSLRNKSFQEWQAEEVILHNHSIFFND
jgi:hypothetical protein